MKRIAFAALIFCVSLAVADRIDTGWGWARCKVETGEELFWGSKHNSYPATYLFDNDPRTAWVFSGLLKEDVDRYSKRPKDERDSLKEEVGEPEDRYWITISPSERLLIDGLRIMNGYNKSADTFQKNRRVIELEVWAGGSYRMPGEKPIKVVQLSDKMGWHTVSLPKTYLGHDAQLTIRLTKFVGDASQDIALSGLELLHGGKVVDVHMPEIVDYTSGMD